MPDNVCRVAKLFETVKKDSRILTFQISDFTSPFDFRDLIFTPQMSYSGLFIVCNLPLGHAKTINSHRVRASFVMRLGLNDIAKRQ